MAKLIPLDINKNRVESSLTKKLWYRIHWSALNTLLLCILIAIVLSK